MTDGKNIEDLIEASSLGTPQAKALREEGRRVLRGEGAGRDFDDRLQAIADGFTAGDIDEREAYERCLEIGCRPRGARGHVSRWASGRDA